MERFPSKPSAHFAHGNRFGSDNDGSDGRRFPLSDRTTLGCCVCFRRTNLATGRSGSISGHSKSAGAAQNHCHPRRGKPGQRRDFFHLLSFRCGRRHDWQLFARAGKLAISFCSHRRRLCGSRGGLAGNTGAKTPGRSAGANNVVAADTVHCLFQWRAAACLGHPGGGDCRDVLRMAGAADFERAYATASRASLGNGFIHSQRNSFHAHRPSTAASHPGASAGFCISRRKAGGAGPSGDRADSLCLDVRRDLFTALLQRNVSP